MRAGKYVNDKVYVEVGKGAADDSEDARVEVEILPNLSLDAETDAEGKAASASSGGSTIELGRSARAPPRRARSARPSDRSTFGTPFDLNLIGLWTLYLKEVRRFLKVPAGERSRRRW